MLHRFHPFSTRRNNNERATKPTTPGIFYFGSEQSPMLASGLWRLFACLPASFDSGQHVHPSRALSNISVQHSHSAARMESVIKPVVINRPALHAVACSSTCLRGMEFL
jgi:hypothetical protein